MPRNVGYGRFRARRVARVFVRRRRVAFRRPVAVRRFRRVRRR